MKPETNLREIPKWARRYAKNRTLPAVLLFGIILVLVAPIGPLVYLVERAYRSGQTTQAVLYLVPAAGLITLLLWIRSAGAPRIGRWLNRAVYAKEGGVETDAKDWERAKAIASSPVMYLYLFCLMVWVGLGVLHIISNRVQTASFGLIFVPFAYYCYLVKLRGRVSPFLLAWPALVGLHCLLVALVPAAYIRGGPGGLYETLNLLIPTIGYAILCCLAGHIYSRFALRRLRAVARTPESEAAEARQ